MGIHSLSDMALDVQGNAIVAALENVGPCQMSGAIIHDCPGPYMLLRVSPDGPSVSVIARGLPIPTMGAGGGAARCDSLSIHVRNAPPTVSASAQTALLGLATTLAITFIDPAKGTSTGSPSTGATAALPSP